MSMLLFQRRRQSSASATRPTTIGGEGAFAATGDSTSHNGSSINVPQRPAARKRALSNTSAAAFSSSMNLPSRSYIHHASHGLQETVQYASSAVRDQTAELSSSFLSDSDLSRRFSTDRGTTLLLPREHGTIDETSEPVTPVGAPQEALTSTKLEETLSASLSTDSMDHDDDHRPRPVPSAARSTTISSIPAVVIDSENPQAASETSPLLPREHLSSRRPRRYSNDAEAERQNVGEVGRWNRIGHQYPNFRRVIDVLSTPKSWNPRQIARQVIYEPASMLPAVFLGLLLNLLDALSYGIILFPLTESAFADLGADGVSMFYVSCIISQLVYSTGSIFKGGVGSEMIEVIPFFHRMTYTIMAQMGTDNTDALRATVITSYAMSSIMTGVVFLGLGSARLGTLVNFFPHSILTGCIGGVGIFLFVTGIEVSARLDGNLAFTLPVLQQLFTGMTAALWIPPLALASILLIVKHFYDRPWLVPTYYIGITLVFYIVTWAVPTIDMAGLRSGGWVFEAPPAERAFYSFYGLYKFDLVDWNAIWLTVPSQLALTFFGILHVPINVPNLAMVVQEDNVSINRELIMHGISNTLSGCVGSIQNYLVFVNSVLFMNTGADSRLAGFMLAAATFGLWVAGPTVIGYVPVLVVGTLIYMLGIELVVEALISTYGRLDRLEYATIIIIALVMGLHDFVVGIAVGIGLACLVYVVQTSQKTVIRAEFSGTVAESTVRRHPRHRNYLRNVGKQIRIVKLGGYLFFGSIVKVEKRVRALIDHEAFAAAPIRFLILDFTHVSGIDFSASEAFNRMNRILHRREVSIAVAGVRLDSEVGKSLQMVGLFVEGSDDPPISPPKVYEDLNSALEACENNLLVILTEKQRAELASDDPPPIPIPELSSQHAVPQMDFTIGSPRRDMLYQEATSTIQGIPRPPAQWHHLQQPLPLLMQTIQDLTDQAAEFWVRAVPFFTRREFPQGTVLYARGDRPDGFYLLQSGLLRAEYALEQGAYHESIVAGTTCGELPFFSDTARTCTVLADRDCVAWLLTSEGWQGLQNTHPDVATELLKIGMKLSAERMNAITSYVLVTAS